MDGRDGVTKKVGEVLGSAEYTHVVSSRQHEVLLAEIARRVVESAGISATSIFGLSRYAASD